MAEAEASLVSAADGGVSWAEAEKSEFMLLYQLRDLWYNGLQPEPMKGSGLKSGCGRRSNTEPALSQYIAGIIRRWRLILACAVVAALAAAVVSVLTPPTYEARAGLVISRVRPQVVFEPKLATLSDESLNALRIDTKARQNTLVALVRNPAVEAQVIRDLGGELPPGERKAGALLGSGVTGKIAKGELIEIITRDSDPARAAMIANSWAQAYEKYVNELYSGSTESPELIEAQVESARRKYQAAELELTDFIGANRITALRSEISSTKRSLAHHYEVINRAEEMMTDAGALLTLLEQGERSGTGQFASG